MDFKTYNEAEKLTNEVIQNNYSDFIKALVSVEKGITDRDKLDKVYQMFLDDDDVGSFLNDKFDEYISQLEINASERKEPKKSLVSELKEIKESVSEKGQVPLKNNIEIE